MGGHNILYICTCLVLLSLDQGHCENQGTYVLVVPSIMRPGRPLDISVSILNNNPTVVSIYAKVFYNMSQSSEVVIPRDGFTRTTPAPLPPTPVTVVDTTESITNQGKVTLNIPEDIALRTHSLYITGNGDGISFANHTLISVESKTLSIFIQTDKRMYKPGKTVRMRAMAIYSNLKPYQGNFNITIQDPNKSIIKQWKNKTSPNGVISGLDLQLSDQPVLGDWTIKVVTELNAQKEKTVKFSVAEYVLPKFEVNVITPSFMLADHTSLKATVTAKYTYGQNVKGKAMISAFIKTYSNWERENYQYKMINTTVTMVNGVAEVTYTRDNLMYLAGNTPCNSPACFAKDDCVATYAHIERKLMYKTIMFHAEVTEELTGNMISTNSTVEVKPFPVKMSFMETASSTFKPGLKYTALIQFSRMDDSPLIEADYMDGSGKADKFLVTFKCSNNTHYQQDITEVNYTISETGLTEIDVTPDINTTNCFIQARYKYATTSKSISKFESRDGQGISVTAPGLTGNVQVGTVMEFSVTTTEVVSAYNYEILSKGIIVHSSTMPTYGQQTSSFTVNFDAELCRQSSPSARLVVWCITDKNELIADTLNFNVDGAFANEVSLEFTPTETLPGSNLTLTVQAHSGSYVGLLAVDQSVLLMGAGNEITQEGVMNELRQYDSSRYSYPIYYRSWFYPRPTGGQDTSEVITNAGISVLTDAIIYKKYVPPRPTFNGDRGLVADSGPRAMPGAPGVAGERGQMAPRGPAGPPAPEMESAADDMSPELQEPERVRTEFPETWIWAEQTIGPEGKVMLNVQAPDTITSWVATAFAMNQNVGMGVTETPTNLKVFKPFFVSLNLPYSVIRTEEIALQATVFNYLTEDVDVTVTLEASMDFDVKRPNDVAPVSNTDVNKIVTIPAGDGVTVSFWIVPKRIGQMKLSVMARSYAAADKVERNLLVEPEGEHHEFTKNLLINHGTESTFTETMSVEFPPENVVPGSQRAVFNLIGDVMGPSISGLDRLLRMPYGCGEQNMINFAPNIYILQYLEATNQMTSAIYNKAMTYLETGYQRQLTYRRTEGSFSAFGNSDIAGSTWLTAFVIRSFHEAGNYLDVDPEVIETAANWITRYQDRSGMFQEPGRVIHSSLQGGSAKGTGLTAYIATSLLEVRTGIYNSRIRNLVDTSINNALSYLENQLPNMSSNAYELSLVTYALTIANRPKAQEALAAFDALATVEGTTRYWTGADETTPVYPEPFWYRYRQASSYDIEMTSYGLLTYTKLGKISDATGIVMWIVKQRNGYGGFRSTQDTVIAMKALSAIESVMGAKGTQNMDVTINVDGVEHSFQKITPNNVMVLQSHEMNSAISEVEVTATGTGIAVFQMVVHYHQTTTDDLSGITLTVTSDIDDNGHVITTACGTWTRDESSGMAVLEMNTLTAYRPLTDTIVSSSASYGVRRYEVNDKSLTIYLDELPLNEEICITVTSVNMSPVTNLQPAIVKMYPYYNPYNQVAGFYLPDKLKDASMCNSCPDCCYDNCMSQPCRNEGRCIDDMNTYSCVCKAGFTGKNCQDRNDIVKVSEIRDNNSASVQSISSILFSAVLFFLYVTL